MEPGKSSFAPHAQISCGTPEGGLPLPERPKAGAANGGPCTTGADSPADLLLAGSLLSDPDRRIMERHRSASRSPKHKHLACP
eukprot:952840-Amphidinium_carterae.2